MDLVCHDLKHNKDETKMNIFVLLCIPLLGYAFKNFHRAFLIYIIFRIFLTPFIPVFVLPGLPFFRLETFCNTFFISYAFFNYIQKTRSVPLFFDKNFPWRHSFTLFICSIIISSIFSSISPLLQVFPAAYLETTDVFLIVYLFWKEVKTEKDIMFLINGFFIAFLVIIAYGIFERFNSFENPLILYEQMLNPANASNEKMLWSYSEDGRAGLGRVTSVFAHAIGCGGFIAIVFIFYLYTMFKHPSLWPIPKAIQIIFLLGLLIVLLFTNSRGPLLFLLIALLPFFHVKYIFKFLIIAFIGVIFFGGLINDYLDTFLSIFNSNAAEKVGGSNIDMRINQFEVMFDIWSNNPLLGNGAKATNYWLEKDLGLLGGESVWIGLFLNQGLLGVIAYVYLLFSIIKNSRGDSKWVSRFLVIAWLCFNTATSTPGITISFLMIIILIINKINDFSLPNKVYLTNGKNDFATTK